ncbi:MAG TPA: TonB family protein [Candidatus Acidoferrum sp.]|nr:TonB family protein [Candidatus Acidoferrum sp.]
MRENLAQLLLPVAVKPASANGAPIHLLKYDKSMSPARAQGASVLTHGALFAALLLVFARPNIPIHHPGQNETPPSKTVSIPAGLIRTLTTDRLEKSGGQGGDQNPVPATSGNLPPLSRVQIVKPMLPPEQHPVLPEPPTILDRNATAILTQSDKIGLPWNAHETDSAGPGKGHSLGSRDGNTLGDGGPGPGGDGGGDNLYRAVATSPGCVYCPYPTYTDDARHGKVQGSVMLEVLVGTDGRAHGVRLLRGIGFGLDERAVATVETWKFAPARDAAGRPVAAWITVEAVFRLF